VETKVPPAVETILTIRMTLGGWAYLKAATEAAWASLEQGMSPETAAKLLGQPRAIRTNRNCVVYQYPPMVGAGSLTFIDGLLASWKEPQLDELPPAELWNATIGVVPPSSLVQAVAGMDIETPD